MTDLALSLLKVFEGYSPQVYRDLAGHPTVGYGHKLLHGELAQYAGRRVEPREAEELLISDFAKHRAGVLSLTSTVSLEDHEADALTSFCFNFGEGALAGSTLLRRVRAGDRRAAAYEFTRWRNVKLLDAAGRPVIDPETGKPRLKPAPGLIRRRHVEACWYLGAHMQTLMYVLGDQAA